MTNFQLFVDYHCTVQRVPEFCRLGRRYFSKFQLFVDYHCTVQRVPEFCRLRDDILVNF